MRILGLLLLCFAFVRASAQGATAVAPGCNLAVAGSVLSYYRKLDAGDIEGAIAWFAPQAMYLRGARPFEGRDAIFHFYSTVRNLKGRHEITELMTVGNEIKIEGIFKGTFGEGTSGEQPVRLLFKDLWHFDDTFEFVTFRQSQIFDNEGKPAVF